MIPDVTPNGVFYLPPTGWLTSFYNPPCKNIKFYRQVSGLTQEKLAEKADLSVKFISMIESNPKRNISIQSLAKIAAALNIPLATLISKEDDLKDQRPYTKMLIDVLEKMPREVSESFSMNFLENIKIFKKYSN